MVKRIAIIGAGVTGLSAAFKIREEIPEANILVIEREEVIGGMAKTIEWEGCRLDLGPHRFYTEIPGINQFVRDLCRGHFVPVKRKSHLVLNGRFLRYPVSPLEIMKILGIRSSAGIASSTAATLLPKSKIKPTTYEEYVRNRFGKRVYEMLFGPYARKVWGREPSELDAETAVVRLKGDSIWQSIMDAFRKKGTTYVSQFLYPTGGIGVIPSHLAKSLKKEQPLLGVGEVFPEIENGQCVGVRDQAGKIHSADTVISTIPLPTLATRLFPEDSEACNAAQELKFRSLVILYLLYDTKLPIDDTWFYFPEPEIPFTRLSVPGNFHPDSVPFGKTALCLEFPCDYDDEQFNADESTFRKMADRHLKEIGLVDRDADRGHVVQLTEGYPIYTVGYRNHVNTIVNSLRQIPNLITVGRQGLFTHNNLDQAIQMGLLAGAHVCRFPDESDRWYDELSRFDGYRIVD